MKASLCFWNIRAHSTSFLSCFFSPQRRYMLQTIILQKEEEKNIFLQSPTSPLFLSLFCLQNMSRHPMVKWAQRSDKIYLTVDLPDAKDVKVKVEPEGKFIFSATKDQVLYEVDIDLFDKINTEESKVSIGLRSIVCVIKKAEKKWWARLVKQVGKPPAFFKVDWDKWVDEEEEEKGGLDIDDMDFSKLGVGGDDFDMDEPEDEEVAEGSGEKEEDEEEIEKKEPSAPHTEETKA